VGNRALPYLHLVSDFTSSVELYAMKPLSSVSKEGICLVVFHVIYYRFATWPHPPVHCYLPLVTMLAAFRLIQSLDISGALSFLERRSVGPLCAVSIGSPASPVSPSSPQSGMSCPLCSVVCVIA